MYFFDLRHVGVVDVDMSYRLGVISFSKRTGAGPLDCVLVALLLGDPAGTLLNHILLVDEGIQSSLKEVFKGTCSQQLRCSSGRECQI